MEQGCIDGLMNFGLTRQEATIYIALNKADGLSGYEVAKITGISRSNAYSSLSGLVDKGAAMMLEGDTTKYVSVNFTEFANNKIRGLEEEKKRLEKSIPTKQADTEGYLTIKGDENIKNKMITMLEAAEQRVYISMSISFLAEIEETLKGLVKKSIKITIITDDVYSLDGAVVYLSKPKENQIGIITDSVNVLSGEYKSGADDTALFSGQPNFVRVFKDSLRNEIELIDLKKEN